jgi:hypothetical protein
MREDPYSCQILDISTYRRLRSLVYTNASKVYGKRKRLSNADLSNLYRFRTLVDGTVIDSTSLSLCLMEVREATDP